jgi:outer membrane biosynthesis protein TonB
MTKYLLIGAGSIVIILVGIIYFLWNKNEDLVASNAILTTVNEIQQNTIDTMILMAEIIEEENRKLNEGLTQSERKNNELKKKLEEAELENLAKKDPKLAEEKANKILKELFDEIDKLTDPKVEE